MANRSVLIKDLTDLSDRIVKRGYSYRQLASEIGCSQTLISLMMKGERNPSPETAVELCKVLKCRFDDIFFIDYDDKSN